MAFPATCPPCSSSGAASLRRWRIWLAIPFILAANEAPVSPTKHSRHNHFASLIASSHMMNSVDLKIIPDTSLTGALGEGHVAQLARTIEAKRCACSSKGFVYLAPRIAGVS